MWETIALNSIGDAENPKHPQAVRPWIISPPIMPDNIVSHKYTYLCYFCNIVLVQIFFKKVIVFKLMFFGEIKKQIWQKYGWNPFPGRLFEFVNRFRISRLQVAQNRQKIQKKWNSPILFFSRWVKLIVGMIFF